jgi:hypothetical protein
MSDQNFSSDAARVFEPDVLLPVQHARRTGVRRGQRGEQRLMMAILEDAVDVYLKHAGAKQGAKRALFEDAEQWVDDADTTWIFSFESICAVLDIDPDAIRDGLHAHKRRARGERGTVVTLPMRTPRQPSELGVLVDARA